MKKMILGLFLVLAASSAHAWVYEAKAKNLLFVTFNGDGYTNGIKIFDNQKFLFGLGHVEEKEYAMGHLVQDDHFEDDSLDHMEEVASELKAYVDTFPPETLLRLEQAKWNEYNIKAFITRVETGSTAKK